MIHALTMELQTQLHALTLWLHFEHTLENSVENITISTLSSVPVTDNLSKDVMGLAIYSLTALAEILCLYTDREHCTTPN